MHFFLELCPFFDLDFSSYVMHLTAKRWYQYALFLFYNYPLPNEKVLALLKAFAEDKFNAAKMLISFCDRVENIVGNGENAGYQHFLLFLQCFQKVSSSGSLKVGIVW